MSDCLFCKIVAGEIPSDKVYEDEDVYAFRDIEPWPEHILFVPKNHIQSLRISIPAIPRFYPGYSEGSPLWQRNRTRERLPRRIEQRAASPAIGTSPIFTCLRAAT